MLKLKRIIGRKAQNTAEYAILIALVVGAVIAMQTYVQRAMHGRFLDTTKFMTDATQNVTGTDYQYEPYYQNSEYNTDRTSGELLNERATARMSKKDSMSHKVGFENTSFNAAGVKAY